MATITPTRWTVTAGTLTALVIDNGGTVSTTILRDDGSDVHAFDNAQQALDWTEVYLGALAQADADLKAAREAAAAAEQQARKDADRAAGRAEWEPGLNVVVGEVFIYGERRYRVLQAHTTQQDWTPDVTPALWEPLDTGTAGTRSRPNR